MNIASMKYLIGYRDALNTLHAEYQGYASYWTYSADARGYTRGWSAGYEQGQRDEREAAAQRLKVVRDAADVALLGTLQTTRDRVIAAIDDLKGEQA